MSASTLIFEVAVPSPLYRSFDYRAPGTSGHHLPVPGTRLLVPFGQRRVVGILLAIKQGSDLPAGKLKQVLEILDTEPVLGSDLMKLLGWAAHYYHHPIGETLATALPVLLRKPASRPDMHVMVWKLTDTGRQHSLENLARAPRQAAVLRMLAEHAQGLEREALSVPLEVLKKLQHKGWIQRIELAQIQTERIVNPSDTQHALTVQQQAAANAVQSCLNSFHAFLLEGVTGSGKTEVYLRSIEPLLQERKQVLVLVPEIGLTPQLVERFRQRFAVDIAVLHSGLNDSQRLHAWQRAASGAALLILGTRSAIFTPLKNPGLIIVDEEHDTSLKQQDGFRYSARDLAVWRARQLNIPVLLGSATPSLESLYNVQQGRYQLLDLPERAGKALAPSMRLLDLRRQTMSNLLSAALLEAMDAHLNKGGQILLFLNRRGFAPVLLCHACGWVAECRRCDARMTLHQRSGELRCHHCGSQRRIDAFCPACGSSELLGIGEGTERIEQALQERFPDIPILRIDRDTTRRKGELEAALSAAETGTARILLGTQMLAKGHHFPGVTLAAILDADQGLFSTDFRASERMAQLIIQVAGRAGRAERPGEVMIQTHHPDHPLLLQLVESGYPAFARAALEERQEALLPPYASMALLRAEATSAEQPKAFLETARELAEPSQSETLQLWGPVAAPMERRAGRYRAQLLIQARHRSELQQLLKLWIPQFEAIKDSRRVRWSIDVDPVDMF
jgi:primosomal protein N' (replication factor Y)